MLKPLNSTFTPEIPVRYIFSNRSTPLGQTALQIPQPTQDARIMSSCRCAYALTSMPISQ